MTSESELALPMTRKKVPKRNQGLTATAPKWYICQSCGTCCRWPGFVRLDRPTIGRISAFLGMSEEVFIGRYAEMLPSRTGLMLASRADHSCIFFDGTRCEIHPVKPGRCREFPNGWNFPGWRDLCHAAEVAG